ncbi:MAG: porphobilinogen synthase [Pseudomonadota bacterium]
MKRHFPQTAAGFPRVRLRRTRQAGWVRRLVGEHRLGVDDLVWPVFVQEGKGTRTAVPSMPGVARLTVDLLVEAAKEAAELGLPAIAIFPAIDPQRKTPEGEESTNPENLICRAIRAVKKEKLDLGVVCDVALDPFTSHGHDGVLRDGAVDNDATIEVLCRQAIVQAEAGCDVIAPSDMMDGRIGAVRDALDGKGFQSVLILAYAAKFASAFYGPFRDAIGSAANLKGTDKSGYQMDPANGDEALREIALDLAEGADMILVKPGLPYLDVIRRAKDIFGVPTLAYQVSGEYAMLKAAAEAGWLDWERVLLESLLAFKRAGADAILSYAAMEAARLLRGR